MAKKENARIAYTPIQHVSAEKNGSKTWMWLVGAAGVIIVLAVVCVNQFLAMAALRDGSKTETQVAQEAKDMKAKVGQLMKLPDEDATIATVQDTTKLNGQEFFRDAQNGDKILIFPEAKKAILYREGEHKIINSGPIVINSSVSADSVTTSNNSTPAVVDEEASGSAEAD